VVVLTKFCADSISNVTGCDQHYPVSISYREIKVFRHQNCVQIGPGTRPACSVFARGSFLE